MPASCSTPHTLAAPTQHLLPQAIVEAAGLNAAGGKQRKIVVTGCMAQRYGEGLAADLPEADLVIGFEGQPNLARTLAAQLGVAATSAATPAAAAPARVQVGSATVPFRPEAQRHRLTPRHSAYLRIAEGCDHKCTFCGIPSWRGRLRCVRGGGVLRLLCVLCACCGGASSRSRCCLTCCPPFPACPHAAGANPGRQCW
jgi:tRNA A37 methylthiotransferase MiaB